MISERELAVRGAKILLKQALDDVRELKAFLRSGKSELKKHVKFKMSAQARKNISLGRKKFLAKKKKKHHFSPEALAALRRTAANARAAMAKKRAEGKANWDRIVESETQTQEVLQENSQQA